MAKPQILTRGVASAFVLSLTSLGPLCSNDICVEERVDLMSILGSGLNRADRAVLLEGSDDHLPHYTWEQKEARLARV